MKSVSKSEVAVKRILFAVICIPLFLLMATATPAQTTPPADPCTPALPVSLDKTGCGALITVYTVDGNGNATSFAVTPVGLSYDSDDWLVGIVNNASAPLKSITLSTPATSTTGIFAFDGDGPCALNRADCFYGNSASKSAPYYGYAGPNNTFTGISSGGKSGTVSFTKAIPTFSACTGQFCNTTWFALEGLPVTNVTQQVNPVAPTGSSTVTNTFNSSTTIVQEIKFPSNISNLNGSNNLATTNFPVPTSTWPQYVVGTPWAPSICIAHLGNGGTGNLCSLYVNACWNSATQTLATASDAFCPTALSSALGVITLKDTFDWTKQPINPGTTVSLIAFTPPLSTPYLQWAPSSASVNPVCANILSPNTPCYIIDRLVEMYGDQTTTRGTSPKTKSWNITALNVPMLLTSVYAAPNSATAIPAGTSACPLQASAALNDPNPASLTFESPTFAAGKWFNGNCFIDFVVNPAQAPTPNNNFVAAIPAALAYGSPVIPNPSTPLTNTASASPWDTLSQLNGQTLAALAGGDGAGKIIQWSAIDAAGISEKNIQLIPSGSNLPCENPDNQAGLVPPCYNTSLFTTNVNIDSFPPTASITLAPTATGNVYYVGQQVTATANCADALSGLATTGGCVSTNFTSGGTINTLTAGGPYTLTTKATDKAGNSTTTSVNYSVGDFTITATPPSQSISSGQQGPLFTIKVTPVGASLPGSVGLFCSVVSTTSTGLACSISPNSDALTGGSIFSTVTLTASKNATHGTYTITFTGSYPNGGAPVLTHSASVQLTVKGNNN